MEKKQHVDLVYTQGLTKCSLFKMLFVGFLFSMGPIVIVICSLGLLGVEGMQIQYDNYTLTALETFLTGFMLAPVMSFVMAVCSWFFLAIGCWLYTRMRVLRLRFYRV
jgi:hypothetical protein